jgi:hypothetical protein
MLMGANLARPGHIRARAFSAEVDAGSAPERATIQDSGARLRFNKNESRSRCAIPFDRRRIEEDEAAQEIL